MAEKTYFVVQAFEKKGKRLLAVQPTQCRSDDDAIGRAERDAKRFAGVVAFRQVADDETGEVLDEPVVLARHGELPANMADE
ncbi:hypothetical protein SAMN06297251_102161 [Fulvimarina manganoxydans]|uniref:Uncharacterized protein n=1 Tax=Fulvimarina manganoxydans TaxID=937218 RepID=A0A1W1Z5H7_9HYPH|nr:hypothetical protein [Fulvimarina manganoxydans]SMC43371.1 hypothetical protein SAMN06297251_102161 [Fulvimarina manganoxydans]